VSKRGGAKEQDEVTAKVVALVKKGMTQAQAQKKVVDELNKQAQAEHKAEQKEAVQEVKAKVEEKKEEAHEKGLKEVKKEEAYLAKEYAKEFPKQTLKGGALKKHMTDWIAKQLKKMDCGCGCIGNEETTGTRRRSQRFRGTTQVDSEVWGTHEEPSVEGW